MSANKLLSTLAPEHACLILENLREADRKLYRSFVEAAARRRKLRPEFLDRKPLPERHAWVIAELGRPTSATPAAELLQTWLLTCRKAMLRDFLDTMDVPHDGEGVVESLPPEPPEATLRHAVATLLTKYPDWEVRIYLEMFCQMDIANWPHLRQIVADTFPTPTRAAL